MKGATTMFTVLGGFLAMVLAAGAEKPFTIEVVDRETGRGVPMVELTTVNHLRYLTDSNGIVAFDEPGLMDQKVFFYVNSHGYKFAKDGFGFEGKALDIVPGGKARLEIDRVNIAERLYRITGGGIYADGVKVGRAVPLKHPTLNGQVFGSDSVQNAIYHGKLFWFWGDTCRPAYPLGNFKMTGATSELPDKGGLEPEKGVDLNYFVGESGFAKSMAPLESPGPVWVGGIVVLRDKANRERMFAYYDKIRGTADSFSSAERGLVEYNDQSNTFRHAVTFPMQGPFPGGGHPLAYKDGGTEYFLFCDPFPRVRIRADVDALKKPALYEAYTCLKPGSRLSVGAPGGIDVNKAELDRTGDGKVRWGWKADTDGVGPAEVRRLVEAGRISDEEARFQLRDVKSGKIVLAHRGTVAWNEYRKRWIMILCQIGGTSMLGEIWYAEAKELLGPWSPACKIVTHDRYSFYNPRHHPYFDRQGGRIIYFEGTYTAAFSGNTDLTPRYDYNQIMYRLDLSKVPPLAEAEKK
jgi:hypothetical protein